MDPSKVTIASGSLSAAQRGKIRRLAAPVEGGPDEESAGEINVVPFLDIITNVLMFVLATVAITFTATIDTQQARPGPRPPSAPALGLTVVVVSDGFAVKARGGNVAPGCSEAGAGLAVPKRDGAFDYDALKRCVSKLKASAPAFANENGVTITANPNVPYDVVVATMDAVRSSTDGADLFPEVSLAIAR
jgi:biopolymer transport protein ExbD